MRVLTDARAMGAIPVVSSRKGTKTPEPCPDYIYRHRNLIESCWARLKERRAIATRYDKTALSYAAGIAIAASLDWIKALISQEFKCKQILAKTLTGMRFRNLMGSASTTKSYIISAACPMPVSPS
jgi:hypothetical protein